MSIRIQIGRPLSDLPNLNGFQFRGVAENGDLIPCRVVQRPNGLHEIIEETDESPAFHRLRGWVQWLPPKGYLK